MKHRDSKAKVTAQQRIMDLLLKIMGCISFAVSVTEGIVIPGSQNR